NDTGNNLVSWQAKGTWTVVSGVNEPPQLISVSPSSGSGAGAVLTAFYRDPNGATDLPWAQMNINAVLSDQNACYVHYDRINNLMYLLNDTATVWLRLVPGTPQTVSNSQCILSGPGSGATVSGSDLLVSWALTFKAAFNGLKGVYI